MDTTGDTQAPPSNVWEQARWLVGRYRRVQILVERVGAIDDDEDGRWPHIELLADILRAHDAYQRAWEKYRRSHYEPAWRDDLTDAENEARLTAYDEAGPKAEDYERDAAIPAGSVHAYAVMSGGEGRLLRILATLGEHRVEFCSGDLDGLDDEGRAFIREWLAILVR